MSVADAVYIVALAGEVVSNTANSNQRILRQCVYAHCLLYMKGEHNMSNEQMKNEIFYKMAKTSLDEMLRKKEITQEEHEKIDKLNRQKFLPMFEKVSA